VVPAGKTVTPPDPEEPPAAVLGAVESLEHDVRIVARARAVKVTGASFMLSLRRAISL
jgi:hypothetical protein